MSKLIIGLVGPSAGGKGTVKDYLRKKFNAEDCRFSTILGDILNRVEVPISRENLQTLSTVLRKTFGEDLLAKAIANDAQKIKSEIAVIDGVRRITDIGHLMPLDNFVLVSVDASPEVRYKRAISRNQYLGDSQKTFEQFLLEHNSEADREIPEVMKSAKVKINNDGSFEDLYQQVDQLIADNLK
jgi:dephospho-CoA kinase